MSHSGTFVLAAALAALVSLTAGCRPAEREAAPPADASPAAVESPAPTTAPAAVESPASPLPAAPAADPLVGVAWVRQDAGAPLGELRIFLADGTLVQDSCWEVYALRRWRRTGPEELVFEEETVEVPARILALGADELRLELSLVGGERQVVAYRRAEVPYVCPEMAR